LKNKKTAGILVLTVMFFSFSSAAWAGMLEYPVMPGPKGVGDKIGSLFGQIAQDLEQQPTPAPAQPLPQPTVQLSWVQAYPTNSSVLINGTRVPFEAYTIENRTHFKLRDLAMAFNGSEKQFEVGWDESVKAINLQTGQPYTASGGELTLTANQGIKKAAFSTAKVYINGVEANLTAYVIDGRTYFRLQDLGSAIDFGITWDGSANTISINTTSGYDLE
jgi:hypothetical protein